MGEECGDAERQAEEILALQSIYSREEFRVLPSKSGDEKYPQRCVLSLHINLSSPVEVRVAESKSKCTVKHLPPVVLRFIFPERYPSAEIPKFRIDAPFLGLKVLQLADELHRVAEGAKGEIVVFDWGETIANCAFDLLALDEGIVIDKSAGKSDEQDSRLAYNQTDDPLKVLKTCEEYDEIKQQELFEEVYYHCGICFESKPGNLCFRMRACGEHVFCKECIQGFFEARINDGMVSEKQICCPGRCGKSAHPTEIEKLIDKKVYVKYERLLLNSAFETLGDILFCPRKNCDGVANRDRDEPRLAECYYCCYSFCALCSRSYHPDSCIDLDKYTTANEEERKNMEKLMTEDVREKALTLEYLRAQGGRRCPHCDMGITKTSGCNKMICHSCENSFCWLCGAPFSSFGYYAYGEHFNGRGYNGGCKLFDDEDENEFYQLIRLNELEDD